MHTPIFWKEKTKRSTALLPAAAVYGFFARRRQAAEGIKLEKPVICIGNAVVGGSGKTPVALAVGELLKAQGKQAQFVTRGYKGKLQGPVKVDNARHNAREVGDEPLLLAEVLPTWVAKDRVAGAKAAIAEGAEVLVLDDGFQNPALKKDVSLLVIDGAYGFGNNRLLPAGPLREPVSDAMMRATAIVLVGEDRHGVLASVPAGKPVLRARIEPLPEARNLKDTAVMAFAGIARPRKFYRTLQDLGCSVVQMVGYPDHYAFRPRDLAFLTKRAAELGAKLVTTAKDYVRLPMEMREKVIRVPVRGVFEDDAALLDIILKP